MDTLGRSFADAIGLLWGMDSSLIETVVLTLEVTLVALVIALVIGIPIGAAIGLARHLPGRWLVVPLIYTGMGLPPVTVGLFTYLVLSNQGPLGGLGWLFTPAGMIVAQTIIALPLVVGLTMAAVQGVDPNLPVQMVSLGATRRQVARRLSPTPNKRSSSLSTASATSSTTRSSRPRHADAAALRLAPR